MFLVMSTGDLESYYRQHVSTLMYMPLAKGIGVFSAEILRGVGCSRALTSPLLSGDLIAN